MTASISMLQRRRRQDFRDDEDVLSYSKREDDVMSLVLDWTEDLALIGSTETIASVAYEDSGVTRSGTSNTTTTTTDKVTGLGETEITVTTNNSHKIQRLVRFYSSDGHRDSDYE